MSGRSRAALRRTKTSVQGDATRDEVIDALVHALRAEQADHANTKRGQYAAARQATEAKAAARALATEAATAAKQDESRAEAEAMDEELSSLKEQVADLSATLSTERQSFVQWQAQQTQCMAAMQREMRSFWLMATPDERVDQLHQRLGRLKPTELRATAVKAGVEPAQLREAEDSEDPTAAVSELLLARLASKGVANEITHGLLSAEQPPATTSASLDAELRVELAALRSECADMRAREKHTRHAAATTARLLGESMSRVLALERQQDKAQLQTQPAKSHPLPPSKPQPAEPPPRLQTDRSNSVAVQPEGDCTLPSECSLMTVGLGWRAQDGLDLDASILVLRDLDGDGVPDICACVDYRALSWENGVIEHKGDSITGDEEGDDETILVHLDRIPANIERLVVCVNIYTPGASFSMVDGAYARVCAMDDNRQQEVELVRYTPNTSVSTNGLVIAALHRLSPTAASTQLSKYSGGTGRRQSQHCGWSFQAIGLGVQAQGRTGARDAVFQAKVLELFDAAPAPAHQQTRGAGRRNRQPFWLGAEEEEEAAHGGGESSSSEEDEYADEVTSVTIEQQASELARARQPTKQTAVLEEALTSNAASFFLKRTLHIGGVGLHWQENESEMAKFFDARFGAGAVLVAVVRQRAPTETSGPHNSWCLVTFSEITIVDSVMAGQETSRIPTGVDDGRGGPPVTFVVRNISKEKALDSTGSFGKIFNECRKRVAAEFASIAS